MYKIINEYITDKNNTILETCEPVIHHTSVNDAILSILGLTEHGEITAYENFIGIQFYEKLRECAWVDFIETFRFEDMPALRTRVLPQEKIGNNFKEIITSAINQGEYCLYYHETFHVEQYVNYHIKKFQHEVLVYGMDADILHCSDYFDYKHYLRKKVKLSQACTVREAWVSAESDDYIGGIVFYKPVFLEEYKADVKVILNSLKHLMHGEPKQKAGARYTRGFDYFEELEMYLSDETVSQFTPKLFSFVKAYLTMMEKRMEYLSITFDLFNNDMLNRIKSITRQADLLVSLTIKYNFTLDKSIKIRMQKLLRTIRMQYEVLLFEVIAEIENM